MRMDNKVAEAIREENRRLRQALEWYADENNYEEGPIPDVHKVHTWIVPIEQDLGARAREALKEVE